MLIWKIRCPSPWFLKWWTQHFRHKRRPEVRVSPTWGRPAATGVLKAVYSCGQAAGQRRSRKAIQLLYSWLLGDMRRRKRPSSTTFPLLNSAAGPGPSACLCAAAQTFTYFCYFGQAGSPGQLPAADRKTRTGRYAPCLQGYFWLFFPPTGTHKYLEHKRVAGLKYRSHRVSAGGEPFARSAAGNFFECWGTTHTPQSPDRCFHLHWELPSGTVSFHPDISLTLGHCLPLLTNADLEAVSIPRRCGEVPLVPWGEELQRCLLTHLANQPS